VLVVVVEILLPPYGLCRTQWIITKPLVTKAADQPPLLLQLNNVTRRCGC
jgi:hypothetical protein